MGDLNLAEWTEPLLRGLWVTVYVTVLGSVAALVVAFVLGLLVRMEQLIPRAIARTVIELFRGTSLLVQLFWFYLVFPPVTGFYGMTPLQAAVIAFGLNFGAYGAEVVRGSINAVPRAQWEGATALGFSPAQRMRRVLLPQALPLMIPPFGNLLIQLLKSTPLVYLITLVDLFTVANMNRQAEHHAIAIMCLMLVAYFVLAYLTTLGMHVLERRAKARLGRAEPARTLFSFRGPSVEEAEHP